MIWLTLRQFRVQAAVVFGGLAVLGAVLAITGPGLADDYDAGFASCTAHDTCSQFAQTFFNDHSPSFGALIGVAMFLPGLIGIFWGAPLVTRELEHGTHRLVWNQSITRTRWLAVKLSVIGASAMVAAALTVTLVDWWSSPLDKTGGEITRMTPVVFDARGIVPIGYAAFAFALGVTAGVLVRRTLPTMAITLAVFVAVQIAVPLLIRPHLVPPESKTVGITAANLSEMSMQNDDSTHMRVKVGAGRGAWTLSNDTIDASGRKVGELPAGPGAPCAPPPPGTPGEREHADGPGQACFDYLANKGYKQKVVYHPATRFWPLQLAETALYALLTLALTTFCFYWTRRRPT